MLGRICKQEKTLILRKNSLLAAVTRVYRLVAAPVISTKSRGLCFNSGSSCFSFDGCWLECVKLVLEVWMDVVFVEDCGLGGVFFAEDGEVVVMVEFSMEKNFGERGGSER